MTNEYEAKALEIDKEAVRHKLRDLGATLVFSEKTFQRYNFDDAAKSLDAKGGWIRLREGEPDGNWSLGYKTFDMKAEGTIHTVKEVEFLVSSKEKAMEFLKDLGFLIKSYQQRKREQWKLGGLEIDIDTWPWIPTFLEVEGKNEKEVKTCFTQLGLDYSKAMFGSATQVYAKYGFAHINSVQELTFDAKPKN